MPIEGLTTNVRPRFERLGKIRLGIRKVVIDKKTGKPKRRKKPDGSWEEVTYPVATDHFVVPKEVAEAIKEEKPKKLSILFPFDNIDQSFDAWHKLYGFSGLKCQGDGEFIAYAVSGFGEVLVRNGVALMDFEDNSRTFVEGDVIPCSGFGRNLYPKCKKCRAVAHLRVMLRSIPRLGYWQITTGSKNSILNVHGQLQWVKQWFGRLVGIPFILELRREAISCPVEDKEGNHKRIVQDKFILHLEPDPEWVQAFVEKALIESKPLPEPRALPAPEPEEAASVYDEEPFLEDDEDMAPSEEYSGNYEETEASEEVEEGEFVSVLERADEPEEAENFEEDEPVLRDPAEELRAIFDKTKNGFLLSGDEAAPDKLRKRVEAGINGKFGEGSAEKLSIALIGTGPWDWTRVDAMALQNLLLINGSKWDEAIKQIISKNKKKEA